MSSMPCNQAQHNSLERLADRATPNRYPSRLIAWANTIVDGLKKKCQAAAWHVRNTANHWEKNYSTCPLPPVVIRQVP